MRSGIKHSAPTALKTPETTPVSAAVYKAAARRSCGPESSRVAAGQSLGGQFAVVGDHISTRSKQLTLGVTMMSDKVRQTKLAVQGGLHSAVKQTKRRFSK
ncbi:hypothetical protein TKK_0015653 [Trichogramma kaykai]